MPNLTPQSPLMQPVTWQGQEYFTSQYFHAQYLANSQAQTAKYRLHGNFLRLLRSIEAFNLYVNQRAIIELVWRRIKTEGNQNVISLQPLFQAAGWNPITLLNATAQVAMSHHLDDALSQQMSVVANMAIARQATAPMLLDQYPEMRAIVEQAQALIALATKTAETRAIADAAQQEAEHARAEAAQATANAARALEGQLFFTVAEYVCFNALHRQVPTSTYKACSDHLRLYCMDHNIPFRKIPVGGHKWTEEYGFHVSVYAEAFTAWLKRRAAQPTLHVIHTP